MSKRDIDSLLNRGKHYVCQYITSGCYEPSTEKTLDGPINLGEKLLQNHDHRRVHHVIDHLFDYRHHFSAEELTEWIKYMVGGRRLPNTFAREGSYIYICFTFVTFLFAFLFNSEKL